MEKERRERGDEEERRSQQINAWYKHSLPCNSNCSVQRYSHSKKLRKMPFLKTDTCGTMNIYIQHYHN